MGTYMNTTFARYLRIGDRIRHSLHGSMGTIGEVRVSDRINNTRTIVHGWMQCDGCKIEQAHSHAFVMTADTLLMVERH